MFLGQAGTFLSFQARRSSATRSSTSDLTVMSFGFPLQRDLYNAAVVKKKQVLDRQTSGLLLCFRADSVTAAFQIVGIGTLTETVFILHKL